MSATGIWVGELDLADDTSPHGVSSYAPDFDDTTARILVRAGREVVGFVDAPIVAGEVQIAPASLAELAPVSPSVSLDALEPITVVVCTRDRPDVLAGCLERLAQLRYPVFEVLVVDNAPSTDATQALVARRGATDPRFRYTREERPGLSCARNHGLRTARTRIVAFTDDDVLVDAWWLHGIARGFGRSPEVTCVTGVVPAAELSDAGQQYFDERYSWADRFTARLYDLAEHRDESPLYPFSAGLFGTGANFAVDRFAMLDAGGFDEALGAGTATKGGEDLDAFVRVLFEGGVIAYEPSALVWHRHRADTDEQRNQLSGYGVGLTAFITKCLLDRRMRGRVARRVPHGALHLVRAWRDAPAKPNRGVAPVRTEALGMLRGPTAYLQAKYKLPRLEAWDAAGPLAIALWLVSVGRIDPDAMTSWGLLPALPVTFFVAFALLIVSSARQLARHNNAPARRSLHLIALIVMIHGTAPLVIDGPIYSWLYKHLGVISYIGGTGALDGSVDIYQNWPGFFALAAWFSSVSGVGDAMSFAGWAPVFFNLLSCLELNIIFRSLGVTERTRWLGLFFFIAGNWVGQDYLAPQALAFVIGLGVLAVVLGRYTVGVRSQQRLLTTALVYVAFSAVVITHQLSPLAVVLPVALMTLWRLVRPWWLVVGLVFLMGGYVAWHWEYLNQTQDLFGPLGDPIRNLLGSPSESVPVRGRRITALGAPALVAWLLLLGALGAARRLRAREPMRTLVVLLVAPLLIAFGQNYGGEVVFRIYLFSLPWIAVLAASLWDASTARRGRVWTIGVALAGAVGLLGLTFFGSLELYRVRPGEVAAAHHFYKNAQPNSLLVLTAPNFPTRLASNYDQFSLAGVNPPALLTTVKALRHRNLGSADVARVARFVETRTPPGGTGYVVLSKTQTEFAEVVGLAPPGAIDGLQRALAGSQKFSIFYANADAVIFRLSSTAQPPSIRPPVLPEPAPTEPQPLGILVALTGLAAVLIAAAAQRRRIAVSVPPSQELAMNLESRSVTELADDIIGRLSTIRGMDPNAGDNSVRLREVAVDDLSPTVRTAALELLGTADETAQVAALRAGLVDPQAEVRRAALTHLSVASTPAGARLVFDAFLDNDDEVREAAYRCVARAGEWLLWLALRSTNGATTLVTIARKEIGDDRVRTLVAERAQSPEPSDRQLALQVASALGGNQPNEAVSNALLDPDPAARLAAIAALSAGPATVGPLVDRALTDPDPTVRLAALDAVREIEHDRVMIALVQAAADTDPDVRSIALDGLQRHNSPGLAKLIGHRIDTSNAGTLAHVLLQLGAAGEEMLVEVLASDNEAVALSVAAYVRGTGVETRARAAAQGLDTQRRARATQALQRLGSLDTLVDLNADAHTGANAATSATWS